MKISDIEVTLVDHMGSDLSCVNAARVSFAKESFWTELGIDGTDFVHKVLQEQDARLINYLAKHKHYSPFNHTFLSFRIKAPVYAARQLVKHEYMPWNEVSRRYVDDEPEFYMPELRGRAADKKQGSSDEIIIGKSMWGFRNLQEDVTEYTEESLKMYKHLISEGVAPEVARGFLPHTLMTEWIWSGTLKAFHKMLSLRLKLDSQKEARIVAEKIAPVIEELFPVSFKALMANP